MELNRVVLEELTALSEQPKPKPVASLFSVSPRQDTYIGLFQS